MNKIYSIEEIKKIEQHEFKRLKDSFILMNRAGTNCAKKIHKLHTKKKIIVFWLIFKHDSIRELTPIGWWTSSSYNVGIHYMDTGGQQSEPKWWR